ncbi:MAG: CZB domain-containing protein [Pseudomonadales bacterium]|nr:CZB domain-containing protein [Pseudomonadales bacterium]
MWRFIKPSVVSFFPEEVISMQNALNLSSADNIAGSYLTFRVGNAAFALAVGCVRYITSRDAITTRTVPDTSYERHSVFEHDGLPVPLYRFSELIESHSRSDESAALIELLKARKQDHINWLDALEHSLRSGEPFVKATDPHKCEFGRWYDNYQAEDQELQEILVRFDAPHKHIHSLAERLLDLALTDEGKVESLKIIAEERHATLRQLLELFDQAQARLQDMTKPVVIILENGSRSFAIELDSIDGMMEFTSKNFLADVHKDHDEEALCYDGYFQTDQGDLFLKVDPQHLLTR